MIVDFEWIWKTNIAQFSLSDMSFHGPGHWRTVERNGLLLAQRNGADQELVRLFAVYHDAKRENEGYDPEHGFRAAELLAEHIRSDKLKLDAEVFEKLTMALQFHNNGQVSDDVDIGTCWDADRMDLPRVGMDVDAEYMSTALGKRFAYESFAAFDDDLDN